MRPITHLLPGNNLTCFVISGLFSASECAQLLSPEVLDSFQSANAYYPPFYRNNERLVRDNPQMALELFEKIKPYLPEIITVNGNNEAERGTWKYKTLNERFRYCKYHANQFFGRHLDGVHYRSDSVQSKLTFMVYLNSAPDFEGGRTLFFKDKNTPEIWASYIPQRGDLIVFDHNLWHEGEQVTAGNKYVLRSDILYERVSESTFSENKKYNEGHLGYIWKMIRFNEEWVISGGRDKSIKVWDAEGTCIQRLLGHQHSVLCLAQMNMTTFISGSRDKDVFVWEKKNDGFVLKQRVKSHTASVLALCRITDTLFASAGADHCILLSHLDGTSRGILEGHQSWIWGLQKITDDRLLSWSEDGTMRLWDLTDFSCLQILREASAVHAVIYNKETGRLLLGNYAGQIKVYDCPANFTDITHLKTVEAHQGIVRSLVVQNKWLASGGEDNQVRIWDAETLENRTNFSHQNFVQSLLALHDDTLLSASYDGQIKRWEFGQE